MEDVAQADTPGTDEFRYRVVYTEWSRAVMKIVETKLYSKSDNAVVLR